MVPAEESVYREICSACRRPRSVCYCGEIRPIPTQTKVVLLQHPRERDMPIGTARMASLCLPNSELHVGLHWEQSSTFQKLLHDPERPAALLYPGEGSIDLSDAPPEGPITLIVVDGTWSQTKKLVKENPSLAKLPRYAFRPDAPSDYRIRREPQETFVSTIEALVYVLGALEGGRERFEPILRPFRVMVDAQIAARAARVASGATDGRMRLKKRLVPPKYPSAFADETIVCVTAELNAWPFDAPERQAANYRDEVVHWAAARFSPTGELLGTWSRAVAPEGALAPRTLELLRLPPEALEVGVARTLLGAEFSAWLGNDACACWGTTTAGFLASLAPGRARLDLREIGRAATRSKAGTLSDFAQRFERNTQSLEERLAASVRGRAASRLGELARVVAQFRQAARAERAKGA
jgi:DTW domain-containing protein YfiP